MVCSHIGLFPYRILFTHHRPSHPLLLLQYLYGHKPSTSHRFSPLITCGPDPSTPSLCFSSCSHTYFELIFSNMFVYLDTSCLYIANAIGGLYWTVLEQTRLRSLFVMPLPPQVKNSISSLWRASDITWGGGGRAVTLSHAVTYVACCHF